MLWMHFSSLLNCQGRLLLFSCFSPAFIRKWSILHDLHVHVCSSFCPHNFWPCQSSWWVQCSSGCPESTVLLKRGWGVEESQAVSVPLILCWKHMSKREVSYQCSNQAFRLAYARLGITTCQGSWLPNLQECINNVHSHYSGSAQDKLNICTAPCLGRSY